MSRSCGHSRDQYQYLNPMDLRRIYFQPLLFPILFFGLTILAGGALLCQPVCLHNGQVLSWTDGLFTACSATCVTGLAVVDTGTVFSTVGQGVILALIQIGGLGIMSLASLALYLFRQRVTLTDRIAVGQNLLQDSSFHLGRFLLKIVVGTFAIELAGAFLLQLATGGAMSLPSAVFHSVSAFCNAGFSLYGDSLTRWADNVPVNLVFICLIVLGGIGFFVMTDVVDWVVHRISPGSRGAHKFLSWYSRVVVRTTLYLIVGGTAAIFFGQWWGQPQQHSLGHVLLTSLFQSVSCRTAGFNTVDIGGLADVTLLFMMALMFIGAAPGSCGGGIKVTTFRIVLAFLHAELLGRDQAVVGRIAASREAVRKAMSLAAFSVLLVCGAVIVLSISERWGVHGAQIQPTLVAIGFEVVSAFATAGLSMGLTPHLSLVGKYVIITLMFIGRLGPLVFVGVLSTLNKRVAYSRPESDLLIG